VQIRPVLLLLDENGNALLGVRRVQKYNRNAISNENLFTSAAINHQIIEA